MISESDKVILLTLKYANGKISAAERRQLNDLVANDIHKATAVETLAITGLSYRTRLFNLRRRILVFLADKFHVKPRKKYF